MTVTDLTILSRASTTTSIWVDSPQDLLDPLQAQPGGQGGGQPGTGPKQLAGEEEFTERNINN